MNVAQRALLAARAARVTIARPRCQVVITVNDDEADEQRQPGAVGDLRQVRGEEQQVDEQERRRRRRPASSGTLQRRAADVEEQQRRDRDRAGHRHAVGERERGRALEREHQREHRRQQQPVDRTARRSGRSPRRGVHDPQAREVAELHRLVATENAPVITACEAMTVAAVARNTIGPAPSRARAGRTG